MEHLGDELLLRILRQIEPQERKSLAFVCRQWEGLVRGLQRKLYIDLKDLEPPSDDARSSHSAGGLAQLSHALHRRPNQIQDLDMKISPRTEHYELAASLAVMLAPALSHLSLKMWWTGVEEHYPEQTPMQWMALLPNLEGLSLSHMNQFPPYLDRLTSLTYLSMSMFSRIVLPSSISRLTRLEIIETYDTFFEGDTAVLGCFPKLRQLHCVVFAGLDMDWLQVCTQISRLVMSGMEHYAPTPPWDCLELALQPLTQLEYLDLSCNDLEMCPPCVASMSRLHTLLLGSNTTGTLPVGPYLKSLHDLDLMYTWITELPEAALPQLTQLTRLNIGTGDVFEEGMSAEQAQQWCRQLVRLPRLLRLEVEKSDFERYGGLMTSALPMAVVVGTQ